MLGMKNHFDISGSIEIREVDIAGVACILLGLNDDIVELFRDLGSPLILDPQVFEDFHSSITAHYSTTFTIKILRFTPENLLYYPKI